MPFNSVQRHASPRTLLLPLKKGSLPQGVREVVSRQLCDHRKNTNPPGRNDEAIVLFDKRNGQQGEQQSVEIICQERQPSYRAG